MTQAENLRAAAARARKTAEEAHREARACVRHAYYNLANQALRVAREQEQRAMALDAEADRLENGKPKPWWRLLPIPCGGEDS